MYAIDGDDGIGPSILSYKNVNTDLYKRGSDGAWNLHENNVLTGVEVNDVCVVDDTIYAYAGQEGTVVYTGKTPTDLTKRATVAESIGDPGCHYDPNTGDFHLYYEQGDPGDTGFSGERIGHSVSPDGINDWEHLEPVVDTTDTDFDVGDPRLIKVGDTFHLFVDYNREETLERIAHYYGSGYSNFERDQVVVTGSQYNAPSDERAVSHPFANGVGDGSPRFIDGVWKLFFEANTDCGGEIWVAESTGPTPADDYEIETVRRYRPIN